MGPPTLPGTRDVAGETMRTSSRPGPTFSESAPPLGDVTSYVTRKGDGVS